MKFSRDYYVLLQAQVVSQLGTHIFNLARIYWLMETVKKGYLVGSLLMACSLVYTVVSPVTGSFVDRHSKKKILILSDLFCGLAMIAITQVVWTQLNIDWQVVGLFAFSMSISAATAFFNTAIAATIPLSVSRERLYSANSLFASAGQFAQIFGQGCGGLLFAWMGGPVLFLINGISFFLSALIQVFLSHSVAQPLVQPKTAATEGVFSRVAGEISAGMDVISASPGMRRFVAYLSIDTFLLMPVFVLTPYLAKEGTNHGAQSYGLFIGSLSAGMLLGFFLTPIFRWIKREDALHASAQWYFFARAISTSVIGLSSQVELSMTAFLILGLSTAYTGIELSTRLQLSAPAELLGRIFGLINALRNIGTPVAFLLSGVLIDLSGLSAASIFVVTGLASLCLVSWFLIGGGLNGLARN